MKKMPRCILLLLLFTGACHRPAPGKLLRSTLIMTRLVTVHFTPAFFSQLQELDAQGLLIVSQEGQLTPVSAVDYVNIRLVLPLQNALLELNRIRPSDKSQALVEALQQVLDYGIQVFSEDYSRVAWMIDVGRPQKQIDMRIDRLFKQNGPQMDLRLLHLNNEISRFIEVYQIEYPYTLPQLQEAQ